MNHARCFRPRDQAGFSLIELVAFIVIVSVLVVGLFGALANSLGGKAPQAGQTDLTAEITQQRMELILAQRRVQGFAAFLPATFDPCSGATPPAVCTPPSGYTVTSGLALNWGGDANYKVVTVTVTGPFNVVTTALVANY